MDCKVNWTDKAWDTYETNIKYLIAEWTKNELTNFVQTVDKKIALLAKYPELGSPKSKKHTNIRCTIIHKRILLIYRYKPLKKEIDLLLFWNTAKHQKKLKIN